MPKLKFLVVEDDLFYQTYVNDLLAETGVDIITATDGEAALSLAVSELPDLILTDIEIPKIQGFVFFKMLRERPETRDIPVIMMSGKVEKALLDRHSSLSTHADGYLVKPFSGQALIDKIREVIGDDFGYSEVVIPSGDLGDDKAGSADPDRGEPEVVQIPERGSAGDKVVRSITVLIVDDSRYICDISRDFLEELGVQVEVASDGETGYQLACDLLPDAILLDVQMPNMNGFVVCEMLRKRDETKNIPIILMSAVVDDDSFKRHSKLRYHADAYLQKPFMKSELHELMRRFTRLGEAASADVETKTGFFVPSEDQAIRDTESPPSDAGDARLSAELEQARLDLKQLADGKVQLETDAERLRKEKDQLEAELFELKKTMEGKESGIQDKLTLVTQRFEEARSEAERLAAENSGLQARLDELSAADKGPEYISGIEDELRRAREDLSLKITENRELSKKLEEAADSEDLNAQLSELGAKLQETSAVALEMQNRNKVLEEEAAKLREESVSETADVRKEADQNELEKEIEALKRDLNAATAAKKEIEDQARSLLDSGAKDDGSAQIRKELQKALAEKEMLKSTLLDAEEKLKEMDNLKALLAEEKEEAERLRGEVEKVPAGVDEELATLKNKMESAIERADSLEEERNRLVESLEKLGDTNAEKDRLLKLSADFEKELDESRKLAADETQARMDLEGRLDSLLQEKTLLKNELDEALSQLDDLDGTLDRILELEKMVESEKNLRSDAEIVIDKLRKEVVETSTVQEKLEKEEKENSLLRSELADMRRRCERLEKGASKEDLARSDEKIFDKSDSALWDERFTKLESTLGKTVREAQTALKEQKDRESALEENIESLVRSLEEEREAYQRERSQWTEKEVELRDAFEDALKESRRLMGEEAARLYPMHVPRRTRPLEVVTWTSKYGIVAAAVLAGVVLFSGGYLLRSRGVSPQARAPEQVQSQAPATGQQTVHFTPPAPWIARQSPEATYEDLWRRNTVQSVSDDMMIQATLHTRDELEAAIQYTAQREGWTRERIEKAMSDMARTYNLSGSYYITVYSKNLKSGYPGYADSFEKHIALRDSSGREVRARFPSELEGSKFITSRISSAGKEMNPVFLYEVGLTVAFAREGLVDKPEGLQLVLYDIGAVPMRVLTWDVSGIGSLSYSESGKGQMKGS
jgi:DNA-binding response OmpR family regulator